MSNDLDGSVNVIRKKARTEPTATTFVLFSRTRDEAMKYCPISGYQGQYKKDYEIVSPECGELRILRYNSGRHDSTSMIFGRHITAVEAKVKYKFRLQRRDPVKTNGLHSQPTGIRFGPTLQRDVWELTAARYWKAETIAFYLFNRSQLSTSHKHAVKRRRTAFSCLILLSDPDQGTEPLKSDLYVKHKENMCVCDGKGDLQSNVLLGQGCGAGTSGSAWDLSPLWRREFGEGDN
ncbi:hypothetical protein Bbelb_250290 [Branchiostoma belcheri]|nr:hypothetical protein Bbelb_250290 [Branchiostoma belcheri]